MELHLTRAVVLFQLSCCAMSFKKNKKTKREEIYVFLCTIILCICSLINNLIQGDYWFDGHEIDQGFPRGLSQTVLLCSYFVYIHTVLLLRFFYLLNIIISDFVW